MLGLRVVGLESCRWNNSTSEEAGSADSSSENSAALDAQSATSDKVIEDSVVTEELISRSCSSREKGSSSRSRGALRGAGLLVLLRPFCSSDEEAPSRTHPAVPEPTPTRLGIPPAAGEGNLYQPCCPSSSESETSSEAKEPNEEEELHGDTGTEKMVKN